MVFEFRSADKYKVEIDSYEAFRVLCKCLGMDFVLDEDADYFVANGAVCETVNGRDKVIDDRADLFIALRNVAVNMFPNTSFRNADYIYHSED